MISAFNLHIHKSSNDTAIDKKKPSYFIYTNSTQDMRRLTVNMMNTNNMIKSAKSYTVWVI